jgi:hypothetical protein
MSRVTIVTGIWDIGRHDLNAGLCRSYQHYMDKLELLLPIKCNMIIFGNDELRQFVEKRRSKQTTRFVTRSVDWFRRHEFFIKIQTIRNNPNWLNSTGWLSRSLQAVLKDYNPLVMSRMLLLSEAAEMDTFDSSYMFWLDGGIAHKVNPVLFTNDNVLEQIPKLISKFMFICFPYHAVENEIHGFNYQRLNDMAGSQVLNVARCGFFGGPKNTIAEINDIYLKLLNTTLEDRLMGTDESIFSIMCAKHVDLVDVFEIGSDGLIERFFENVKTNDAVLKMWDERTNENNTIDLNSLNVALYVISFNCPKQFEKLIESMESYDGDFLKKPRRYLLNNSTDKSTFEPYQALCYKFDFEHIVPEQGNLGICGGRQFIAEHFKNTGFDFMFFFEDDMLFSHQSVTCRNGFIRFTDRFYMKTLEIIHKEALDFLKLNFTEFYGDNGTQWAWYNVPQHVRERNWPMKTSLPASGFDDNAPKTIFKTILNHKGIPYALGDIYYCNWPQIVSKEGNKKMFLKNTWEMPFEQTWMSFMFQEMQNGNIVPGILLMTPTEHTRVESYESELRKES